jgi:hypothetical protein
MGKIGLVLAWAIGILFAHLAMFTCRGIAFESGCDYRGFASGCGSLFGQSRSEQSVSPESSDS